MGVREEVMKTYRMLKDAGFKVEDVVFEGAMTVKGREVLERLEDLSGKGRALGSVRVVYSSGKDQLRTISIPVGEPIPEARGSGDEDIGL